MLRVDLCIDYDMADAISTDDLATGIDYKGIASAVRETLASREWKLLETLTHDVATTVRRMNPKIEKVEATVTKDVIPDVDSVAVRLEVR